MSVAFGDVVLHTIGGGWGSEEPGVGDVPVRIIRGADFPDIEMRQISNLPLRYEPPAKVVSRALREGDIVLETSGGTTDRPTGRTVFISAAMLEDSVEVLIPASFCRLVRIDAEKADPKFVYFALQHLYAGGGTWEFQNQSTGISNFQYEVFRKRYVLPTIEREEQRMIAEVLSALDDKIASNAKLARASDELASVLFRSAVRSAKWSNSTFEDLAKVSGGGTPSTKVQEYWDGDVHWATPTDVTSLMGPYLSVTRRRITEEGLASCSSALYEPGAILMTSRATIGAFAIAQVPTAVNQGFIVVQPKDSAMTWWLFHEMRSRVEEFISLANGATFLELSRGNFRKLKVRLADGSTIPEFDGQAASLHAAARVALDENQTLAATRDALIPALMSGKLRVRDAENAIEGVL